ncbi:lipid binding protein [Sistotremastrum niveocremeum HHB9708]|uniref:Sorting nexin-4 n=2 Tax=Sistotremastraceae TaxID=3402574 RepID=A0A164XDG3_9AGAM|nr:lipid binding protein [Sistotremastrum niveocremeum HHB9708]KZT41416.1 hypothetical protein SISSUDRAFT_1043010 [Sistotremastrum suecicum HHB10207 ss-3]
MEEDDVFDSVTWDTPADVRNNDTHTPLGQGTPVGLGFRLPSESDTGPRDPNEPKWEGYLVTAVQDPVKELAETKDTYVSYLVSAKTNLSHFTNKNPSARRRYQDFRFLRENIAKDFPACVVPPLPEKHRMEYITGDRFSAEFIERRRQDLALFLERIGRHPVLQRATLVQAFFESTEWSVKMHQHIAHPPGPEPSPSLLDNLSDSILNAFARVRKPDERFLEMRENVDKFEEGIQGVDRLWMRSKTRVNDLTSDYHDLAVAVQGLGFLESGITDPLNHFSNTLLEFSSIMRNCNDNTTEPFLNHLHSLLQYSHTNRAVLKLRDQKQLDFEELSAYLSSVVEERDRLAAIVSGRAGSSGLGLGSYIRDRVDALRGADDDRSRVEKMRKLDIKIKELQDAVTTAHDTSDAFSDQTLSEQAVFQHAKEAEMKTMLTNLADGQIAAYKESMQEWDRIIPILQRIRVDV